VLRVSLLSESEFTIVGHGVHSAFIDNAQHLDVANDARRVSPWDLKHSDILHVHSAGPLALALMHRHSGPRIATAHITAQSFIGSLSYAEAFGSFLNGYLRHFYSQPDLILAVSAGAASELHAMGIERPIRVLPNAVDCASLLKTSGRRDAIRAKLGWDGRQVILAVGQVQPRKGVKEFIECAEMFPEANFVWIGSFLFGPLSAERAQLRQAICGAPSNVTFTGILPRPRVYEHYAAADIFFHPSHHETFGLAILEAAAAGLPILLRDLPLYRDIYGNGYIAADGDFAGALRMLIQSRDHRQDLGAKALRVARKYDQRMHWNDLRAAYFHATELWQARSTAM